MTKICFHFRWFSGEQYGVQRLPDEFFWTFRQRLWAILEGNSWISFIFYKLIFPVVVKSCKVVSIDLTWVFSCLFYYNGVYKRPNWIPPPIQFLFFCSLAHRFLCSVVKKIFDRVKELTQNVFAHRCYFRAKREREIKIVVPPKEMHQKTEKTTWHNIKYN